MRLRVKEPRPATFAEPSRALQTYEVNDDQKYSSKSSIVPAYGAMRYSGVALQFMKSSKGMSTLRFGGRVIDTMQRRPAQRRPGQRRPGQRRPGRRAWLRTSAVGRTIAAARPHRRPAHFFQPESAPPPWSAEGLLLKSMSVIMTGMCRTKGATKVPIDLRMTQATRGGVRLWGRGVLSALQS
jgi:hypothetical protein